jgi:hypothetical protein
VYLTRKKAIVTEMPLTESHPQQIITEVQDKSISVDRKIELDLMPEIIEQSVEESIKDSFFSNP